MTQRQQNIAPRNALALAREAGGVIVVDAPTPAFAEWFADDLAEAESKSIIIVRRVRAVDSIVQVSPGGALRESGFDMLSRDAIAFLARRARWLHAAAIVFDFSLAHRNDAAFAAYIASTVRMLVSFHLSSPIFIVAPLGHDTWRLQFAAAIGRGRRLKPCEIALRDGVIVDDPNALRQKEDEGEAHLDEALADAPMIFPVVSKEQSRTTEGVAEAMARFEIALDFHLGEIVAHADGLLGDAGKTFTVCMAEGLRPSRGA